MPLDKYFLNLAGEYRVASELLKRGVFATITYGNKKGADIYAIGAYRKTAIVEVKASNSARFVTGFYQKYRTTSMEHPDFWVLYSLDENGVETFFVLSHDELAGAQGERNNPGVKMTWEEQAQSVQKGVDNILAKSLAEHESARHKIVEFCNATR